MKKTIQILTENYNRLEKENNSLKKTNDMLRQNLQKFFPKIIHHSKEFLPNENNQIEILAGRAGAFKAKKLSILTRIKNDNLICCCRKQIKSCSVDLLAITIMGIPQLVSYENSGHINTKYFEISRNVDIGVFGSSPGQGLQMRFKNPNFFAVDIGIVIEGFCASTERIGYDI